MLAFIKSYALEGLIALLAVAGSWGATKAQVQGLEKRVVAVEQIEAKLADIDKKLAVLTQKIDDQRELLEFKISIKK